MAGVMSCKRFISNVLSLKNVGQNEKFLVGNFEVSKTVHSLVELVGFNVN